MAFQHDFDDLTMDNGSERDVSRKQTRDNSVVSQSDNNNNPNGCFDCNICLDSSRDPVVTLCGHLYCWPCIYKWLRVQTTSSESDDRPKCPVCKSYISKASLVPLYGRGTSESESRKPNQSDLTIPRRPTNTLLSTVNQQNHRVLQQQQYFPQSLGSYTSSTSFYSPTISMVGELVFARMFGGSDTNLHGHPYSNYNNFAGSGSPRLRRQEMQLDKSLNRVSIFLFCCIMLCLVLF